MSIPLDITFRGLDRSPAVESLIRERTVKLERYGRDVERCHVVVERPGRRARGNPFHVTIYLTVPGADLVVNRQPQVDSAHRQKGVEERTKSTEVGMQAKDARVAVDEAFKSARRLLEDHERRRRGQVKSHEG